MEKLVLTNDRMVAIKTNLVDGLSVASGAKSSATYYHNKDEQMKAIRKQIANLYKLSKELPLIIANQKGVTGHFASEVLLNEFKNTSRGGACNIVNPIDWYDNGLSDKAVLSTLYNLNENGIPYVLRLFMNLKKAKVNNERTRKIMLGFILGHPNLEFNALKYRNKMAAILKHAYGVKKTSILLSIAAKQANISGLYESDKEAQIANDLLLKYFSGDEMRAFKLLLFIFKRDHNVKYLKRDFPILFEYDKAKTDVTSVEKVPEEVLIGLISNRSHPQYTALWGSAVKRASTKAMLRKNVKVTSVNQQVRQTKSTAKLGVTKTVDVKKATDFMALYKTGYENGFTADLKDAIEKLAEKKKIDNFFYENIGIILDNSNSMRGHRQESKNTPKAVANFTARVLSKSATNAKTVTTEGMSTDLATSFVELLRKEDEGKEYNAIFFLTDGYENAYDGLTNEVLEVYFEATGRDIPVFQVSPITGAEVGANVRKLGANVVTMAINNPSALQPQITARLLEVDTKRWLENQVLALEAATVTRRVKNKVNV